MMTHNRNILDKIDEYYVRLFRYNKSTRRIRKKIIAYIKERS